MIIFDSRYIAASYDDSDSQVYAYNSGSYWKGTVSLIYDYTEIPVLPVTTVPEPSAIALMNSAKLGLGLSRRKMIKNTIYLETR